VSTGRQSTTTAQGTCFVVSPFGSIGNDRERFQQVLWQLIRPVLNPGYKVVRADEIHEEGLITDQIIKHLWMADLVVADLTDHNPNVFYEIAIRHAACKPIVHLIMSNQAIPFDIANMRAVQYGLDRDALAMARDDLAAKVRAIEENDWQQGCNPITRVLGKRSRLRLLAQQMGSGELEYVDWKAVESIHEFVEENGPVALEDLAEHLDMEPHRAKRLLRRLEAAKAVHQAADGRWKAARLIVA
jgi:hypothetical protein